MIFIVIFSLYPFSFIWSFLLTILLAFLLVFRLVLLLVLLLILLLVPLLILLLVFLWRFFWSFFWSFFFLSMCSVLLPTNVSRETFIFIAIRLSQTVTHILQKHFTLSPVVSLYQLYYNIIRVYLREK